MITCKLLAIAVCGSLHNATKGHQQVECNTCTASFENVACSQIWPNTLTLVKLGYAIPADDATPADLSMHQ